MIASLSPAQRATLRKAIVRHPDWPAFRKERGLSIERMTSADLALVAACLGLSLESIDAKRLDLTPAAARATR